MIRVRCLKCGRKYGLPPEHQGKMVRCRHCGHVFRVGEDCSDWLSALAHMERHSDRYTEAGSGEDKLELLVPTEESPASGPTSNPSPAALASPPVASAQPGHVEGAADLWEEAVASSANEPDGALDIPAAAAAVPPVPVAAAVSGDSSPAQAPGADRAAAGPTDAEAQAQAELAAFLAEDERQSRHKAAAAVGPAGDAGAPAQPGPQSAPAATGTEVAAPSLLPPAGASEPVVHVNQPAVAAAMSALAARTAVSASPRVFEAEAIEPTPAPAATAPAPTPDAATPAIVSSIDAQRRRGALRGFCWLLVLQVALGLLLASVGAAGVVCWHLGRFPGFAQPATALGARITAGVVLLVALMAQALLALGLWRRYRQAVEGRPTPRV